MTEKNPLLPPKPDRYQRQPTRPPIRRPGGRSLHISISLLILGAFVIYAQKTLRTAGKKVVYAFGGQQLPDWYGVCSKEGKKIYTVPEEGTGVGGVECVVVGGKEVVDAGSLGEWHFYFTDDVQELRLKTARIRRRWGEKGVFGGVDQSPVHIRNAGGLEILYLPPGHSLTPVSPYSPSTPSRPPLMQDDTGLGRLTHSSTRIRPFSATALARVKLDP